MNPRVNDSAHRGGRLKKAREFAHAASLFIDDTNENIELRDAYVTLAVHSGIAFRDVICANVLGEYSSGDSHNSAVALLKKADPKAALLLLRLLGLKTKAGYGHNAVSNREVKTAHSAHIELLERAEHIRS